MQRWFSFVGAGVCVGIVAMAACTTGDAPGELAPAHRPLAAGGVGGNLGLDAGTELVVAVGAGGAADAGVMLVGGAGVGGSNTKDGGSGQVAGAGGSGAAAGAGGSGMDGGKGGSGAAAGAGGSGMDGGKGGSDPVAGAGGSGMDGGPGGSGSVGAGGSPVDGGGGGAPAKLGQGSPCTAGSDCSSSNCIDGICCDTACGGACQACSAVKKGAGVDGACGPIKAGTDPDDECPTQAAATCGTTGDCNGAGACRKFSNGTVCAAASCAGNSQSNVDLCDGNGTCVDGGTMSCAGLGCNGALCKSPCVGDADCPPTAYCEAGLCALKLGLGSPCTAAQASRCGTGFCADGVCCDALCAGGPCLTCKHDTGAPIDGACTAKNGPPCDDSDPSTPCDLCVAGLCKGTPAPPDTCQDVVYSTSRMACTVYSRLDGLPCGAGGKSGICIAGSCLLDAPLKDAGGGGGSATTAQGSSSTAASGQGGSSKPSGGGGDAGFGLQGGGCSVAPSPSSGAPWLLLGLFLGARRSSRSRRRRAPR
jgi:hypothetical protein